MAPTVEGPKAIELFESADDLGAVCVLEVVREQIDETSDRG